MDIVSLPVEIEKENTINRFKLVNLAAQRAKELMEGVKSLKNTKYKKETTIALEEIVTTEFVLLTGKDAREAIRDVSKMIELMGGVSENEGEDSAEIKKDTSVYINDSGKRESGSEEE